MCYKYSQCDLAAPSLSIAGSRLRRTVPSLPLVGRNHFCYLNVRGGWIALLWLLLLLQGERNYVVVLIPPPQKKMKEANNNHFLVALAAVGVLVAVLVGDCSARCCNVVLAQAAAAC